MEIKNITNEWIIFESGWRIFKLEKYYIAEFWIKYGWSFIKNIWQALHNADPINITKILENWKDNIELENILKVYEKEYDMENNELPF